MILKTKKHNYNLYNTLLYLSRNLFFYSKIKLKDTFETRVYLIFFHFSIMLTVFKNKKINFSQQNYDNFFFSKPSRKSSEVPVGGLGCVDGSAGPWSRCEGAPDSDRATYHPSDI